MRINLICAAVLAVCLGARPARCGSSDDVMSHAGSAWDALEDEMAPKAVQPSKAETAPNPAPKPKPAAKAEAPQHKPKVEAQAPAPPAEKTVPDVAPPTPAPAPKEPEPVAKPAEPRPAVKARAPAPQEQAPSPLFDFESGDLNGWTAEGDAFAFQPTYGDNPSARARGQASNHKGSFWIGTYEKRHSKDDAAGGVQGDGPRGTLTSPEFDIRLPGASFLVGGGCDLDTEYVALLVDDKPARRATGKCSESMERAQWDLRDLVGKKARLQLVDDSYGSWGHINFDDFVLEGEPAPAPKN